MSSIPFACAHVCGYPCVSCPHSTRSTGTTGADLQVDMKKLNEETSKLVLDHVRATLPLLCMPRSPHTNPRIYAAPTDTDTGNDAETPVHTT